MDSTPILGIPIPDAEGAALRPQLRQQALRLDTIISEAAPGGAFANPMTTLGDTIYGDAGGVATRRGGNVSAVKKFYTSTGDGVIAAAPLWGALEASDIPSLWAALADDVARTSTVMALLSDLSIIVEAGKVYGFSLLLWATDSNAEGIKLDLDGGTAAMTWFRATFFGVDADTVALVAQSAALASVIDRDSFSGMIRIEGSFLPSSSGTFAPRFAQKVHSAGSITILKGSRISVLEAAT